MAAIQIINLLFPQAERIKVNGLEMMCDGPDLKIQKQLNNKNQENREKNSQSEELKKKRSMMFHQQDSVDPKRPNCEYFTITEFEFIWN